MKEVRKVLRKSIEYLSISGLLITSASSKVQAAGGAYGPHDPVPSDFAGFNTNEIFTILAIAFFFTGIIFLTITKSFREKVAKSSLT
jgi:hypothetical protein